MTIHNQLRRLGPIQRAVKVAFGLDAGEAGLERMSESIVVNRAIWEEPETAVLRDERLCVGGAAILAPAAQMPHISLSMMTAGWILTLERMFISGDIGTAWLSSGISNLANASTTYGFRENRLGTVTAPIGRVYSESNAIAIGTSIMPLEIGAAGSTVVEMPWVLAAYGTTYRAIVIRGSTLNSTLRVGFVWRERPLLPGELDI